ncbi:MAG TPA: hypothetical protein VKV05_03575 [Terriglobales bacterium]|nr:hypothetical protein [Terriglobales bacterium]
MRPKLLSAVLLFVVLTSLTAFTQQTYVSRFDAYGGYAFFDTPSLNLLQNGFNGEFGVNVVKWLALGFDFSVFTGSNNLTPAMLSNSVQQQLGSAIAAGIASGQIPPGYRLNYVPTNSTTYTYSAGPQINFRQLKEVTFFVRPALGALHESATLNPTDPITRALVEGLTGPTFQKTDTVVFYGFGGGMDFNFSRHFALRTAADFVHYDMFSGLLNGGRNSVRFSIGPAIRFGGNILK